MMTSEETKVLAYLRDHGTASVGTLARACLTGWSPDWMTRVVANLDFLGYITVFGESRGAQAMLQLTEKGRAHCAGPHRPVRPANAQTGPGPVPRWA